MATELENLVPEADVEVEGMRGPKGDKGDSYVLTEADKEEIARKVDTIIDAETDKSLTISGKPADAKAAGDEINNLKADLSEIDEIKDGLYDEVPIAKSSTTINYKYKYGTGNTWDSTKQIVSYDVSENDKLKISSNNTYGSETDLFPNIVFFAGTPSPETEVSAIYLGDITQTGWNITIDVPLSAVKMYVIVKKANNSLTVSKLLSVKNKVDQNESDIDAIEARMVHNVSNIGYTYGVSGSPCKEEVSVTREISTESTEKRCSYEFRAWLASNDFRVVYCGMWVKLEKAAKVFICGRRYYPSSNYLKTKPDGTYVFRTMTDVQKNTIAIMDVPADEWTYVYGAAVLGGNGATAVENTAVVTALYDADDDSESYTMSLRNAVFIDLTNDFGYGFEPTADGMKALLEGATDYYFKTTYNIFNSPIAKGVFHKINELNGKHYLSPDIYVDDNNQIHIDNVISEKWPGWNLQRAYGLNKYDTPVPTAIHGAVETDALLSVIPLYGAWSKYGSYPDGAIWGGHLAHFWNNAMTYRLTFMTSSDKQGGDGPSEAVESEYCIFAWSPDGFYNSPAYPLTESQSSHRAVRDVEDRFNAGAYYGQIRIGADVNTKGFLFRAKSLKCFGKIDMNENDLILNTTNLPSSSSYTGTKGMIRVGTSYLYICVDDNTWKRIPLESF